MTEARNEIDILALKGHLYFGLKKSYSECIFPPSVGFGDRSSSNNNIGRNNMHVAYFGLALLLLLPMLLVLLGILPRPALPHPTPSEIQAPPKLFSLPRACFFFEFILFSGFGFGCFYVLIMRLIRFFRADNGRKVARFGLRLRLPLWPLAMAVKVNDKGRLNDKERLGQDGPGHL